MKKAEFEGKISARASIVGVVPLVDDNGLKVLACVFWDDVSCSYRKDVRSGVMARCFECRYYRRFERETDEEDERIMDEIDEERAYLERECARGQRR